MCEACASSHKQVGWHNDKKTPRFSFGQANEVLEDIPITMSHLQNHMLKIMSFLLLIDKIVGF